jgi:H+/Cl- antiporter ClcA
MHDHEKQIPIWFFIGALLALYGVLILGASIYTWLNPPPPERMVKLWSLHAGVWWGALLTMLGLAYVIRFWPSKPESLTGKL